MAQTRKQKQQWLREMGERDARAGYSIESYYWLKMERHNEHDRVDYEIGYRAAKDEMRREAGERQTRRGKVRQPYKMRKTVREFTVPNSYNPAILSPRAELECGHVIRIRTTPNSKAEAIAWMARGMSGKPVMRRCFECGAEETQ